MPPRLARPCASPKPSGPLRHENGRCVHPRSFIPISIPDATGIFLRRTLAPAQRRDSLPVHPARRRVRLVGGAHSVDPRRAGAEPGAARHRAARRRLRRGRLLSARGRTGRPLRRAPRRRLRRPGPDRHPALPRARARHGVAARCRSRLRHGDRLLRRSHQRAGRSRRKAGRPLDDVAAACLVLPGCDDRRLARQRDGGGRRVAVAALPAGVVRAGAAAGRRLSRPAARPSRRVRPRISRSRTGRWSRSASSASAARWRKARWPTGAACS